MNEEEKVKKQLIKNIILNLVTFSVIFYILGIVIYSQFSNSLYISADEELQKAVIQTNNKQLDMQKKPIYKENIEIENREQNPRLVFIERNENGEIIENNAKNNILNDIFKDIQFNKNEINIIYEININNQYSYRAINYQLEDGKYTQVLINVDSENVISQKFRTTLVIAIVISIIFILIASYILSKNTLKPIIASWKKQNQFVQDASHELRTPLAIIQAKQENLLEKPESKIIDNAEDISITLKETQRLTKLIKELMELARSDSNKVKINKEKFNLDAEIKALISLYSEAAYAQNKKLILKLEYKEQIMADLNKIKELLVILLDNSLKYTEENDSIEIKTYKKDNKCIIEVIDTGIGISKEAQEHIFERFYREEKSRTREKGGMGLGLSIAYNIVKIHKGNIRIDKNREKGTRMIVKLPVR